MDLKNILTELRTERATLDAAIFELERLERHSGQPRTAAPAAASNGVQRPQSRQEPGDKPPAPAA